MPMTESSFITINLIASNLKVPVSLMAAPAQLTGNLVYLNQIFALQDDAGEGGIQQEDAEEGPRTPQPWQEAYYTLHLLGKIMKHCPREVRCSLARIPSSCSRPNLIYIPSRHVQHVRYRYAMQLVCLE